MYLFVRPLTPYKPTCFWGNFRLVEINYYYSSLDRLSLAESDSPRVELCSPPLVLVTGYFCSQPFSTWKERKRERGIFFKFWDWKNSKVGAVQISELFLRDISLLNMSKVDSDSLRKYRSLRNKKILIPQREINILNLFGLLWKKNLMHSNFLTVQPLTLVHKSAQRFSETKYNRGKSRPY